MMKKQSTVENNRVKENGVILYEGPSELDGQPIVCIMTGLKTESKNGKTGDMVQVLFMRSDIDPCTAIKTGNDISCCGNCPHRGDGTGKKRTCYVNQAFAPNSIYHAYKRGSYAKTFDINALLKQIDGRHIRWGSYGDPSVVKESILKPFMAIDSTGYTHQWRLFPWLKSFVQASCDNMTDYNIAKSQGWSTFRIRKVGDFTLMKNEVTCPASAEGKHRITCNQCLKCSGLNNRFDTAICIHGPKGKVAEFMRRNANF